MGSAERSRCVARAMRCVPAVATAAAMLLWVLASAQDARQAQPAVQARELPSTSPQLRVVQPMHSGPIDQIRTDASFERLLTASSDKTLRLWRLSDLALLRTIHLPSAPGPEGTPYSIAVSADGRRAYAGGYTGYQWLQGAHVYVIDLSIGRITGTLGPFPGEVVTALDLSADGQRLAVGLGRAGLVELDTATGARLFVDKQYAAPVSFVHHAPDGRLASSAADGCLRVYARSGELVHRRQYPLTPPSQVQCTGGDLGGVRFSPDGRWLAIGQRSRPEVTVLDGQSLVLRRVVRIGPADEASLCCVAWAPDSAALFVAGSAQGDRPTPLYVVRDPAQGEPQRWDIGQQPSANMVPMPDGSLVFATTSPSLVRLRSGASPSAPMLVVAPHNVDFHRTRRDANAFLVAADGASVSFEAQPGRWLHASPLAPPDAVLKPSAAAPATLHPARRRGALAVQTEAGLYAHRRPTRVEGHDVTLAFEEDVRSWAVHPKLRIAALGTQWRVHLLDAAGRALPAWERPPFLPAPAWHTVITDDGRWVVVALGDGTVRWFDVATAQERLGLFVHDNLVDWVAWRPDGHYASSPQGDQYVGWLVNRGATQSPDFFRAVQFERLLYRPDIVRTALQGDAGSDASAGRLAATLSALAVPRVTIESVLPGADGSVSVRFTAESTGQPIAEVGVYVDGIPWLQRRDRAVNERDSRALSRSITIATPGRGALQIRVEAETATSIGFDETSSVRRGDARQRPLGTLWVVAAGVQSFDRVPGLRSLPYATNDATELAAVFARQRSRAYSQVRTTVLTDTSGTAPTKVAVLAALTALDAVRAEDTVLVFLASHGSSDGREYYIVPKDADGADVAKLLAAQKNRSRLADDEAPSLLTGTELTRALRRLPGHRILVLDTCQAGAIGSADPYALIKRSASAQLAMLSAARGDEESFDSLDKGHGVFTYAVLQAVASPSSLPPGPVTLRDAFDAASSGVKGELNLIRASTQDPRRREAIRQTPVMSAPEALQLSVIAIR